MEFLYLKGTDIKVSRLCIGGCPMGRYGWGVVSAQELSETVHTAISKGINFFDTADIYGLGEAERILGDALHSCRDKVVINTKFGVRRSTSGNMFYDNSPDWIETALEKSLRRLKTDYIDVYQIHYRDGKTPLIDIVEVLERIKKQGKIRSYGLSNIVYDECRELDEVEHSFCSFQNEYSLANRTFEKDIIGLANIYSMTPMTWGSLGQGVLTGKYTQNVHFNDDDRRSRGTYVNFHGEKLIHNLRIVEQLQSIATAKDVPVSSVAIRWILERIPESVVIAGVKRPKQLEENLDAISWGLSLSEMGSLDVVSSEFVSDR